MALGVVKGGNNDGRAEYGVEGYIPINSTDWNSVTGSQFSATGNANQKSTVDLRDYLPGRVGTIYIHLGSAVSTNASSGGSASTSMSLINSTGVSSINLFSLSTPYEAGVYHGQGYGGSIKLVFSDSGNKLSTSWEGSFQAGTAEAGTGHSMSTLTNQDISSYDKIRISLSTSAGAGAGASISIGIIPRGELTY
jgi:hypothetical protein